MRTITLALCVALAGCAATTGNTPIQQAAAGSPEAQIAVGAQAVGAASNTAATLLRAHKLTVPQAEGYRTVIGAAAAALHGADAALLDCRRTTGSTTSTSPDPCTPSVGDLIVLALTNIANIKRALDAK